MCPNSSISRKCAASPAVSLAVCPFHLETAASFSAFEAEEKSPDGRKTEYKVNSILNPLKFKTLEITGSISKLNMKIQNNQTIS